MGEVLEPLNDLVKIENEHDAEIKRIISTDNDNRRKREIEELSIKLNHQLKEEELQYLCQRYKNMHIENMFQLKNEHEENQSKIFNEYKAKTDENEKNFNKDMRIIQKEENKDQQIHVENMEKIKSKDQENYLYHVRCIDEQQKNYNNKSKEIDYYYKDLKDQRDLESSKIKGQFEKDIITIERNFENEREKNKYIKEKNEKKIEKEYDLKKREINAKNDLEMRKLDILEKYISNPMMMNAMMMQNPMMMNQMMMMMNPMMIGQTNMKSQCQTQTETGPGPLPVVKNDNDSVSQNPMNFKPMAYPNMNMINPMIFSQMMNVK